MINIVQKIILLIKMDILIDNYPIDSRVSTTNHHYVIELLPNAPLGQINRLGEFGAAPIRKEGRG